MEFQHFTTPYINDEMIGQLHSAGQNTCQHWHLAMTVPAYKGRKRVELTFEGVRLKEYPALPSRKSCIYLFDQNLDPTVYAFSMGFIIQQLTLVEVEAVSARSIGRVNKSLLGRRIQPCGKLITTDEELISDAREYWAGGVHSDIDEEILFCGEFRFTRIISKAKVLHPID